MQHVEGEPSVGGSCARGVGRAQVVDDDDMPPPPELLGRPTGYQFYAVRDDAGRCVDVELRFDLGEDEWIALELIPDELVVFADRLAEWSAELVDEALDEQCP
jgi:hypothetical protein